MTRDIIYGGLNLLDLSYST